MGRLALPLSSVGVTLGSFGGLSLPSIASWVTLLLESGGRFSGGNSPRRLRLEVIVPDVSSDREEGRVLYRRSNGKEENDLWLEKTSLLPPIERSTKARPRFESVSLVECCVRSADPKTS